MLYGELFEMFGFYVTIVLGMWVRKDKRPEIHCLGRAVAKENMKANVARIFCS